MARHRGSTTIGAAIILALTTHAFAAVTFHGLGDLPGGSFTSVPNDVSDDGTTVVGYSASANGDQEAFRWTSGTGMQPLGSLNPSPFLSVARSISADGTTIVGEYRIEQSPGGFAQYNAFRWTVGGGMVSLGELPGGVVSSGAFATSADGSIIVGGSDTSNGFEAMRWTAATAMQSFPGQLMPSPTYDALAFGITRNGAVLVGSSRSTDYHFYQAWRWTPSLGLQGLGHLPGGETTSTAQAVSDDGNVVVGYSGSGNATGPSGSEAFRWTSSGGMVGLGDLPGGDFYSAARDVSADGNIVVGSSFTDVGGPEAFIWDPVNHMRRLRDVLDAAGADLSGWRLNVVDAITGDGQTLVGYGINPNGDGEAWIATLPEPAGLPTLLLLVGL